MHRILASAAILAASAPLALLGMGSAQAGEHGGDCDVTRGVDFCPSPPPVPVPLVPVPMTPVPMTSTPTATATTGRPDSATEPKP